MLAEAIHILTGTGLSQSEIGRRVGLDKSVISRLAREDMVDVRFSAARKLLEMAGWSLVPPNGILVKQGRR